MFGEEILAFLPCAIECILRVLLCEQLIEVVRDRVVNILLSVVQSILGKISKDFRGFQGGPFIDAVFFEFGFRPPPVEPDIPAGIFPGPDDGYVENSFRPAEYCVTGKVSVLGISEICSAKEVPSIINLQCIMRRVGRRRTVA